MLVSIETLPQYYGNIVKEELTVKNVELGADMSQYVSFEIKPNLPVLGKEYGKYIPKIKEEIAKRNQMEVATKVKAGGTEYIELGDTVIELNSENLLITMHGKDGFAFAGEGEIGVVLDTQISEELREEGFVREILSRIQNMRKDSGFEVLDQIKIYVAKNEKIEAIIRKNETSIMKDTLAVEIIYNEEKEDYQELNINGEVIKLIVKKV